MMLILLDNAVKYTSMGGSIAVRVVESANHLEIAVADSGIGIPAEQLPFIFDRFWHVDQVRSRESGGTGLGLAIGHRNCTESWGGIEGRKHRWPQLHSYRSASVLFWTAVESTYIQRAIR
jgi:two-component system phosphate regulon sensor histidine kinase PhoR